MAKATGSWSIISGKADLAPEHHPGEEQKHHCLSIRRRHNLAPRAAFHSSTQRLPPTPNPKPSSPSVHQHTAVSYSTIFTVSLYLGCRYSDYDISKRTKRVTVQIQKHPWHVSVERTGFCLVLLFVVRAGFRNVMGLEAFMAFMAFKLPDPVEAERGYGVERYEWLGTLPKMPLWMQLCAGPLGVVLTLIGRRFAASSLGLEEGRKS